MAVLSVETMGGGGGGGGVLGTMRNLIGRINESYLLNNSPKRQRFFERAWMYICQHLDFLSFLVFVRRVVGWSTLARTW